MYRLYTFLTDRRTLVAAGLLAALGLLALGVMRGGGLGAWPLALGLVLAGVLAAAWLLRRRRTRRAAEGFDELVGDPAGRQAGGKQRAGSQALRERMDEAVRSIRRSRLGQSRGRAALYELPWYVIIGNPAAGKSSAILNSGLQFPFSDERGSVIQGIGGTRNCDWYFTTEGIVLDTAGRYSVSTEDRFEWMTFLDLLRRNRPAAPINGIIIAASVAELTSNNPEFAIDLARKLRQRVQELTERLEVFAPVYVVFTKADLIAGFVDFFDALDPAERENAWGATLPYDPDARDDAVASFDRHFDELSEGLKEMGLVRMAMRRGREPGPAALALPLEFSAIKPMLRIFIATLFEDNPYQFRPVFRGFYFTSALQEGSGVEKASGRLARRFGLTPGKAEVEVVRETRNGYFLLNLFRKVIFADRRLVRRYTHRSRLRARRVAFFAAAMVLGGMFAAWSWSYTGNRQLLAEAEADLGRAVAMQEGRTDLASRLQALELIRVRLERLAALRQDRPLRLRFGLYQGDALEQALRREYFHGMREVMLGNVQHALEDYLQRVVANADRLGETGSDPGSAGMGGGASMYADASPADAQDAYNALKTYLMLADAQRVEPVHLRDQLTRFWRGWLEANRGAMSREEMIGSVERLLSFHIQLSGAPGWPTASPRLGLVEDAREALRRVRRGESARERVYADIRARAATRFAPVTVAGLVGDSEDTTLAGSHAVSGAFTREAWEQFVAPAFTDAAQRESSSNDWVLDRVAIDDLTLSGRPEHVRGELLDRYKLEYVQEWNRFLQGLSVSAFADFGESVARMNRLGDPERSPMRRLLEAVHVETSWDAANTGIDAQAQEAGFSAWFARTILRKPPGSPETDVPHAEVGDDRISRSFSGVARIVDRDGDDGAPLQAYLQSLARVRTRLNAIATQGDPGPGARRLMQETLEGQSELSQVLHRVDEGMLTGLDDTQRHTLRPLLLRPLVQAWSALVPVTEAELNRTWEAQVLGPFRRDLADRYPFQADARVEAPEDEVARIFGPHGAIARFGSEALGPLVVRRGNTLTPRQWADVGLTLSPELILGFADWVEVPGQSSGEAGAARQTVFQVRPHPAYGVAEYTLEIDGQRLRYRNTPPQWANFVWPVPDAHRAAQVSAVDFDGRPLELASFTGADSLTQLFAAADRTPTDNGVVTLQWRNGQAGVSVDVKVISRPAQHSSRSGLLGLQLPASVAGQAVEESR